MDLFVLLIIVLCVLALCLAISNNKIFALAPIAAIVPLATYKANERDKIVKGGADIFNTLFNTKQDINLFDYTNLYFNIKGLIPNNYVYCHNRPINQKCPACKNNLQVLDMQNPNLAFLYSIYYDDDTNIFVSKHIPYYFAGYKCVPILKYAPFCIQTVDDWNLHFDHNGQISKTSMQTNAISDLSLLCSMSKYIMRRKHVIANIIDIVVSLHAKLLIQQDTFEIEIGPEVVYLDTHISYTDLFDMSTYNYTGVQPVNIQVLKGLEKEYVSYQRAIQILRKLSYMLYLFEYKDPKFKLEWYVNLINMFSLIEKIQLFILYKVFNESSYEIIKTQKVVSRYVKLGTYYFIDFDSEEDVKKYLESLDLMFNGKEIVIKVKQNRLKRNISIDVNEHILINKHKEFEFVGKKDQTITEELMNSILINENGFISQVYLHGVTLDVTTNEYHYQDFAKKEKYLFELRMHIQPELTIPYGNLKLPAVLKEQNVEDKHNTQDSTPFNNLVLPICKELSKLTKQIVQTNFAVNTAHLYDRNYDSLVKYIEKNPNFPSFNNSYKKLYHWIKGYDDYTLLSLYSTALSGGKKAHLISLDYFKDWSIYEMPGDGFLGGKTNKPKLQQHLINNFSYNMRIMNDLFFFSNRQFSNLYSYAQVGETMFLPVYTLDIESAGFYKNYSILSEKIEPATKNDPLIKEFGLFGVYMNPININPNDRTLLIRDYIPHYK